MGCAIVGEPNDDDSDGGGTDGYDRPRAGPACIAECEWKDADDGGVVTCVLLLSRLAGCPEATGENGNGDSDDEGEWDKGVVRSEKLGGR